VKVKFCLLGFALTLLSACSSFSAEQVAVADLPDPAMYTLTLAELPSIGTDWQITYDQTSEEEGYKWSYRAYQAYQPGELGVVLESAFAVNNDVVLYTVNMARQDLPQPPQSLGDIQGISWKAAAQLHQLGDKSELWKTAIGDMLTPVWLLQFYQGHAYVRIRLFGFPDQIAPSFIYGMGDIILSRLPKSVDALLSEGDHPVTTQPTYQVTDAPWIFPTASATPPSP